LPAALRGFGFVLAVFISDAGNGGACSIRANTSSNGSFSTVFGTFIERV
jgi:hypothetical protein